VKNKKLLLFLGGLVLSNMAFAQYYKTLPKGVRLGVYRNVKTAVDSTYNKTGNESPLSYQIEANVDFLESIDNETIQTALALLKPYPTAYENLNLGEYKIDAKADVEVDGYGFAYGITNKVTAYMALPVYKANVKLDYKRTKSNSYDTIANNLQDNTNDDFAQAIGTFVDQYSGQLDVDSGFLQSLVVNGLGYDEAGDWRGEGLGDIELGIMYNFLTTNKYGLLLSGGTVAPTGRVDDADIIQDIGFGDGQWDIFAEFGGSYHLSSRFVFNSFYRYTYQFATDKNLRVPYSGDVSFGDEKKTYKEKLGNKGLLHLSTDYYANDWIVINAAYEYSSIDQAQYTARDIDYAYSEEFLANNTNSDAHNVRLTSEFTTVGLYQQKKFALPAVVKFMYQTMLDGTNTAKSDRYEIELRMYF
jgi:hypothetical protein